MPAETSLGEKGQARADGVRDEDWGLRPEGSETDVGLVGVLPTLPVQKALRLHGLYQVLYGSNKGKTIPGAAEGGRQGVSRERPSVWFVGVPF